MSKPLYKLANESHLFAQLSLGDEQAFDQLFYHYKPRIYAFILKMVRSEWLAEEVTQEVFVQLWISRAGMAHVTHHASYVFNIATNKTLNALKKIANQEKLVDKIAYRSTGICNNTEEQLLFRESEQLIRQAVAGLPKQRQLIYRMSREDGLTHEQIANRLGISANTVKNQLVKALKHIRSTLESHTNLFSYAVFVLLTYSQ